MVTASAKRLDKLGNRFEDSGDIKHTVFIQKT